jgi:hypothetical protein
MISGLAPGQSYRFKLSSVANGLESELSSLSGAVDIECAAGKSLLPDGSCGNCAAGHYNDAGSNRVCSQCPVGKHTANRDVAWKLVYRQTATSDTSTYPTKEEWLAPTGINKNDESAAMFSKLGFLEGFRAKDGNFTFKLVWPEMVYPNHNIWMQSSNPSDPVLGKSVSGYKDIEVRHDLEWGGMIYSGDNLQVNRMTTFDGTGAASYFFGVGFTEAYVAPPGIVGGTFPATGADDEFQPVVELWALVDYIGLGAETSMSSHAIYGGVNRIGGRSTKAPGYPAHALDRQMSPFPDHMGAIQSVCVYGGAESLRFDLGAEKPWWRVDLGEPTPITAVALTNIETYATIERTSPPMSIRGGLTASTMEDCASGIVVGSAATVTSDCVLMAQFLEVYHPDSYRIMQLAEVTIYGGFGDEGNTACVPCPNGYTTATSATDSSIGCIKECLAGNYGVVGDFYEGNICHSCPAGQFSPQGQFDECINCPVGYFQAELGISTCAPCDANQGLYSCSTGATQCTRPPVQECPGACNPNAEDLFCVASKHSNSICNPECNYAECNYDGGDCEQVMCDISTVVLDGEFGLLPDGEKTGSCFSKMIGDGRCDAACNTPSCNMDGGDCCERRSGDLTLAFNVSVHEAMGSITKLLPDTNLPKKRVLGTRNVVVAGVMLRQKRMIAGDCSSDSLTASELDVGCLSQTHVSREPYGYDPVFLTASSMYDSYIDERRSTYYEDRNPNQVRNDTNQPYGFHQVELNGDSRMRSVQGVFPVVFDINLDQNAAVSRLSYLKEGYYLDGQSKEVDMRMLMYSGVNDLYAYIRFDFTFEDSGLITLKQQIGIFSTRFPFAGNNIWAVIFMFLLLAYDLYIEVMEFRDSWREEGTFRNASLRYFQDPWNSIDLASIALITCNILITVLFWGAKVQYFSPQSRYTVYEDLQTEAHFFALKDDGQHLRAMDDMLEEAAEIVSFNALMSTLIMINISVMTVRFLKYVDFQAGLGIVTNTFKKCMIELVHFLVLFFCVLAIYAFTGFSLLGKEIPEFKTLGDSFTACLSLVLFADNTIFVQLYNMRDNVAAVLWFYIFTFLVMIILMNVLLAIIVDAHAAIKEDQEHFRPMWTELKEVMENYIHAFGTGHKGRANLSNAEIIDRLDKLSDHLLPDSEDLSSKGPIDLYLGHNQNVDEDIEAIRNSTFRKTIKFHEGAKKLWSRGEVISAMRVGCEVEGLPESERISEDDMLQITEGVFALGQRPTAKQASSMRTVGMQRILLYLLRDADMLERDKKQAAASANSESAVLTLNNESAALALAPLASSAI